jgi:hypothetical protein
MSHDTKTKIAHGIHALHHTEAGKKAIHTIATGTIAVGTAVLAPIVGTAAAPVVTVAAIGYGLYRLFKK